MSARQRNLRAPRDGSFGGLLPFTATGAITTLSYKEDRKEAEDSLLRTLCPWFSIFLAHTRFFSSLFFQDWEEKNLGMRTEACFMLPGTGGKEKKTSKYSMTNVPGPYIQGVHTDSSIHLLIDEAITLYILECPYWLNKKRGTYIKD